MRRNTVCRLWGLGSLGLGFIFLVDFLFLKSSLSSFSFRKLTYIPMQHGMIFCFCSILVQFFHFGPKIGSKQKNHTMHTGTVTKFLETKRTQQTFGKITVEKKL